MFQWFKAFTIKLSFKTYSTVKILKFIVEISDQFSIKCAIKPNNCKYLILGTSIWFHLYFIESKYKTVKEGQLLYYIIKVAAKGTWCSEKPSLRVKIINHIV